MPYATGDVPPLPDRHDSLVKIMDEDGEVLYVRPFVHIGWGTEGNWTGAVRGDLDWDDLLSVEIVALRHTVERKEHVLDALRELRRDLETGVKAPEVQENRCTRDATGEADA